MHLICYMLLSLCMCEAIYIGHPRGEEQWHHGGGHVPSFFFLACHATAGGWPPHLSPCIPILRPSHPRRASLLFNLVSPPSLRSPCCSAPLSWPPLCCSLGSLVLHMGKVSCPLAFCLLCFLYMSFTLVFDGITSFLILSRHVMFNIAFSMPLCATASFCFWLFVSDHVSAP